MIVIGACALAFLPKEKINTSVSTTEILTEQSSSAMVNPYATPAYPQNYSKFLNEFSKNNVGAIDIDYADWKISLKNGEKIEFQIPSWLVDSTILTKANEQGIPINVKMSILEEKSAFTFINILNGLINVLLLGLIAGFIFYLLKSKNMFSSKNKKVNVEKITDTFDSVIGQDAAKKDLSDIIKYLQDPQKYVSMGARVPRGVILYGPPGTGKTKLARAVAKESEANFVAVKASEYNSSIVGVAQQKIREDFKKARSLAPCIIFIDEIDDVAAKRMDTSKSFGGALQERNSSINQLLNELDGFDKTEGVIVIGATNRLESLDSAVTRPGRFDRKVKVDLPDLNGRRMLLEYYISKIKNNGKINIDSIAKRTPGFAGADIEHLCNEAIIAAINEDHEEASQVNFEKALDKILIGDERPANAITNHDRKIVAIHEAGHALCALLQPDATPIHKATIAPRGGAGGFVLQLPENDNQLRSYKEIKANLAVIMGGRMAEELTNGPDGVTTGASSDIQRATEIAAAMVTKWGMRDTESPIYIERDALGNYPPAIRSDIEEIIREAQNKARSLLKDNMDKLQKIKNALLEKETLESDDLKKIIK